MTKKLKRGGFAAVLLILCVPVLAQQRPASQAAVNRIQREVERTLVMLPRYGIFDSLGFKVNGYDVTLFGDVRNASLKSDAQAAVKQIEGVEHVDNKIEILPTSPQDDRIRIAAYRTIYGQPPLDRYALVNVAPIHIIVKNGHITLVGRVNSEADKNLAEIRAKSVEGVFSVENHLQVGSNG